MATITVKVTFFKYGQSAIDIIPTDHEQWNAKISGSKDYDLDPGDYSLTDVTVTGNGGGIVIEQEGRMIGQRTLRAGDSGGIIDFKVN